MCFCVFLGFDLLFLYVTITFYSRNALGDPVRGSGVGDRPGATRWPRSPALEFWLRFHEPSAPIPARLHAARAASHFRLHPGFIWILFSPSRRAGKRRMKAGGLAQGPVSLVQPPSALGPGCGLVGAEGQSALAQS